MGLADIQHVVVLMMENRSFDHFFGYLDLPNIDNLSTGDYSVQALADGAPPVKPRPTTGVDDDYVTCPDPGHGFEDVTQQIFNIDKRALVSSMPPPGAKPNMQGFVRNFATQSPSNCTVNWQPEDIMRCFRPEHLPILTTLAKNYVLIDRWFCSIPGATWPNRFWAHAATTMGYAMMDDAFIRSCLTNSTLTMPTIFNRLSATLGDGDDVPWCCYFFQPPQTATLAALSDYVGQPRYFRRFEEGGDSFGGHYFEGFEKDCLAGDLPFYTFIEPQCNVLAPLNNVLLDNSMHPPGDVRDGERLIATVYNALRRSPLWETTALLITFDEHGGYYDHVVPPRVPAETDYKPVNGFTFDRLGPRVPALVISPWVQKGVVDHGPNTGATIDPNVHYEHASIVATVRELASVGRGKIQPLTMRDNIACTITHLFQSSKRPASDCPEDLGDD